MPEPKYATLETLITVVKVQTTQIIELTLNVLALRMVLTQARALPIPEGDLTTLEKSLRELPAVLALRQELENMAVDNSELLLQLLKNFQGPIQ